MKLQNYLTKNKMRTVVFAEKIGISPQAVWRYLKATRCPPSKIMLKIIAATNGEVTANDFYDLPPAAPAVGKKARAGVPVKPERLLPTRPRRRAGGRDVNGKTGGHGASGGGGVAGGGWPPPPPPDPL